MVPERKSLPPPTPGYCRRAAANAEDQKQRAGEREKNGARLGNGDHMVDREIVAAGEVASSPRKKFSEAFDASVKNLTVNNNTLEIGT
jgi:hypothetical protein